MASPVEFVRKEVESMKEKWERIRAACQGQEAVKALKEKILPRPTFNDESAESLSRYDSYLKRAVFYNVSGRTLEGLTGYVFAKEPRIKLPADIQTLEDNVDGAGVTLQQQAKSALREVLAMGRAGLLVDYPTIQNGRVVTKQDVLDGKVAPTIILYMAEQIVNWKTATVGAKVYTTKLVLKETYSDDEEDEFKVEICTQYRVLDLDAEGVHGRIFRQEEENGEYVQIKDMDYEVTDKGGNPLEEIPFTFLGAINNDDTVDPPPMLDLVNLNLAHFINSADYEEACFLTGQPTPWASGLTKQWVEEIMLGKITLGSRTVIPLPEGGSCGLLQADPNNLPGEAMKHKEAQMVAIGAKLVQEIKVQRTATEAGLQHSSEVSTLTAGALNIFDGYQKSLSIACEFVGTGDTTVVMELSEPLSEDTISADVATSLTAAWQAGLISFSEARKQLRKPGWASEEDSAAKAEIEADGMPPGGVLPGGAQDPNANPQPGGPPVPAPVPKPPKKPAK